MESCWAFIIFVFVRVMASNEHTFRPILFFALLLSIKLNKRAEIGTGNRYVFRIWFHFHKFSFYLKWNCQELKHNIDINKMLSLEIEFIFDVDTIRVGRYFPEIIIFRWHWVWVQSFDSIENHVTEKNVVHSKWKREREGNWNADFPTVDITSEFRQNFQSIKITEIPLLSIENAGSSMSLASICNQIRLFGDIWH